MIDAGFRCSEVLELQANDLFTADDRFYVHVAGGKGSKAGNIEVTPELYHELKELAKAQSKLFDGLYRMAA
jgi:integrase